MELAQTRAASSAARAVLLALLVAPAGWAQADGLGPPTPSSQVAPATADGVPVPPTTAAPTQTQGTPSPSLPAVVMPQRVGRTDVLNVDLVAPGGHMPGSGRPEQVSLLDCLAEALVNSPEIGASRAAIEAARGQKQQARADLLPPVDVAYTEIFQKGKQVAFQPGAPAVTISPDNFRTFNVGSDWVIFSGGAMQAAVAISRMAEVAAQYRDEATINQVTGNTVLAYLQLLRAQELKTVADRTVELATEQVRVSTMSFEAGAVPRVNVLRADAALAAARQGQLQAGNGIELARSKLLSLMGRHVDEPLVVAPAPRVLFDPPQLLESLQLAVQRRPELRAQQANIEINKQAVRAARAGYWPSLAVSSGFTHTVGAGALADKDNWQVALALNLNVWNWGKTAGKVRESQANLTAERNNLERQMRDIELEVRQVVLTLSDSRNRVDQANAEVQSASEAYRIEQLRYNEGEGTFLELLDSRRSLSSAETNLVTAYYDNALAQAGWLGVTGGYLVEGQMNLPGQARPLPALPVRRGSELDELRAKYGLPEADRHRPVSDYTAAADKGWAQATPVSAPPGAVGPPAASPPAAGAAPIQAAEPVPNTEPANPPASSQQAAE